MLAQQPLAARVVVVADRQLLAERAQQLGLPFECLPDTAAPAQSALPVCHVPLVAPVTAGRLDPANAPYVLRTLEAAVDGCLAGRFDAMATAPVHKGVINDAGIPFTGHTEFLAARTGAPHVVMMLAGGGLRVALATTHVAVKDIARHITRDGIERTLRILRRDLIQRFGIATPRIVVAGLNPHAGESGHLGREEINVIAPVLEQLRSEGFQLAGPLPADTLFNRERLRDFDCVLAMYHDQGLPVLVPQASAAASTSRSVCRSSALRSITAPRSTLRAVVKPVPGACALQSRWRQRWRAAKPERFPAAASTH